MSVVIVGSLPLGGINLAAAAAVPVIGPLVKQLDFALTGPFGVGTTGADLTAQLTAQLALQAKLAASLVPALTAKTALTAVLNIQAQIQGLLNGVVSLKALLNLGAPSIDANVTAGIQASAGLVAKLAVRVAGLKAVVDLGLAVKAPAVTFVANLAANLAVGPVVLLSIGAAAPDTLASAGSEIQSLFSAGVADIAPGDTVYGLVLLTKSPSAWASMQTMFKTS